MSRARVNAQIHAHECIDTGQSRGYAKGANGRSRWRRRRLPRQTVSSIGIAGIAPGGKRGGLCETSAEVLSICMRCASRRSRPAFSWSWVRGWFPFNEEDNECHVRAIRDQMKMTYRYYNLLAFLCLEPLHVWRGFWDVFFFYFFVFIILAIFFTKIDKKWSRYFLIRINLSRRIICFL